MSGFRLAITFLCCLIGALTPGVVSAHHGEPPPVRPSKDTRRPSADGRDIVFAATYYKDAIRYDTGRKDANGDPIYASHGDPEDETLEPTSTHLYVVRPDGTGLRRITSGRLECYDPHWASDGSTILFSGSLPGQPTQLYRVCPDGSGLTRLTVGQGEYKWPRWSPDGRSLLLVHRPKGEPEDDGERTMVYDVCTADLTQDGQTLGHIRHIATVFAGDRDWNADWSPDGRWITVLTTPDAKSHIPTATLYDRVGNKVRSLGIASHLSWSPDSRHLFLLGREDRIFDIATGIAIPVTNRFDASFWPDDKHLIGLSAQNGDLSWVGSKNKPGTVQTVSADGKCLCASELKPGATRAHMTGPDGDTDADGIDSGHAYGFFPLPDQPGHLLINAFHYRAGGGQANLYLLDTHSGVFYHLWSGNFIGFSPDGQTCLAADYDWYVHYKRGPQVGPLQIVNLTTGKTQNVTRKLATILGADWRGGPVP